MREKEIQPQEDKNQIEHKIRKRGYIVTAIIASFPIISHIFIDIYHELHFPFSDLGDVAQVSIEIIAILLLGILGTRAISNAIKKKREVEEQYQKEKEEMRRKIIEHMMVVQEQERKRVSRELHDGIGQSLSIIKMNLEMMLQKEITQSIKTFKKDVSTTINLVADAMQELKKLAMDVRPSILDDLGLIPALRGYIETISRGTRITVNFNENVNCVLSPDIEINVYRIVQEAVTNTLKHSKADKIEVTIENKNNSLLLSIRDNGIGFKVEKYSMDNNKLGIINMEERVNLLGGKFHIESNIGQGTSVEVGIPISE